MLATKVTHTSGIEMLYLTSQRIKCQIQVVCRMFGLYLDNDTDINFGKNNYISIGMQLIIILQNCKISIYRRLSSTDLGKDVKADTAAKVYSTYGMPFLFLMEINLELNLTKKLSNSRNYKEYSLIIWYSTDKL